MDLKKEYVDALKIINELHSENRQLKSRVKELEEENKALDKKLQMVIQVSGELCDKCGWAMKFPGDLCRCELEEENKRLKEGLRNIKVHDPWDADSDGSYVWSSTNGNKCYLYKYVDELLTDKE